MDKLEEIMKWQTIETTIGDLICAIQDAALEARIDDKEVSTLTHAILMDILQRRAEAMI